MEITPRAPFPTCIYFCLGDIIAASQGKVTTGEQEYRDRWSPPAPFPFLPSPRSTPSLTPSGVRDQHRTARPDRRPARKPRPPRWSLGQAAAWRGALLGLRQEEDQGGGRAQREQSLGLTPGPDTPSCPNCRASDLNSSQSLNGWSLRFLTCEQGTAPTGGSRATVPRGTVPTGQLARNCANKRQLPK